MKLRRINFLLLREKLLIYGPAMLLVLAAFAVASLFVRPAPQKTLVISAGAEGGAYYRYAQRYRDTLKYDGITLEVRASAGSLQNLQRLRGDIPEVGAAFVQGGTTLPEDSNNMLSLGQMFYEPVWIFHRLPKDTGYLTQLRGKKIAIGPDGSGTQQLVQQLLKVNDIGLENSSLAALTTKEAQEALMGKVDAAFFVAAPDADTVQTLLRAPGIKLMSLAQAEAYARRYPYLARITLPMGVIDFANKLPAQDVELVAAIATIAVRDDLHPALQFALTQAASQVHQSSGIFHGARHFPKGQETELPISSTAERFIKNGPPLLQRYLPFWLAVLLERLVVFLVPLITIMVPVIKFAPAILGWRVRRRLWHWYDELKKLEHAITESPHDRDKHAAEIFRIDDAVRDIPVPISFSEQYYNLRSHVEYVKRRLGIVQSAVAPTDA